MALAATFDDAKAHQVSLQGEDSGILLTPFFGARDKPDLPYAALSQQDPGRVTRTHFHIRDQFQVVVAGKGKLGRHDLAPLGVHFARAYTPYGPLVSDAGAGLSFFVLRAHPDPGPQFFPEQKDKLRQLPDRQPWQVTSQVTIPAPQSGAIAADFLLQSVPGMRDDQGLAAYALWMKPSAQAAAPDPAVGDGQYLVVVNGSLLHNGKEHTALALVFVAPSEGPYRICAGAHGLHALILNFPRPRMRSTGSAVS